MKKLVLVFFSFLVLCGCSASAVTPVLKGITFTAEMTYYNESYTFSGHILKDGSLEVIIEKPDELKDLKLSIKNDQITAEYKGLTYTPVEGTMPFSAVIKEFYDPLKEVIEKGLTADKNGILEVKSENLGYTLTLSPSGLPQRLELPDKRFSVTFYNISVKEDVNE